MGCVQSLFNPSKSRSPSPEREFEPPKFETVPVTRQPKKTYNTSVAGISVTNDRGSHDVDFDTDSDDDMAIKCDDFDRHAMGIEDDLRSVHYVEATALTTLAANSTSVAILGTTAKCKSAGVSPAIQRQRSSSSFSSTASLPSGTQQPVSSQTSLESKNVNMTPVKKLTSKTGTKAVVKSTSKNESQELWLSEAQWAEHLATKVSNNKSTRLLVTESVSPPSSPSPFLTSSPQWPMICSSKQSNLDRMPVGVIEVLDCEPVDQRRPPQTKAQQFAKAQRSTRDNNIPLPVIHAMEIKSNSLGHEDMFKTMMVQPPSSDRHGYRAKMATGSSTFDSSSRKPFLWQSNESKFKYTEDDYSAATEWMINMPVFAKCPPAKSKILSDRQFIGTYRLSKVLVQELTNLLTPFMKNPNTIAGLSIERKILTALRFFASGSYQQDIGEHRGASVSQASVSRCITEVANALNVPEILNKYIHFPSSVSELKEVRLGFYEKFGIPGVIGVIDGTHIAIVPSNLNDPVYPEHVYVNRKGYHSINTQLICDSNLKILNVCAKFPGSTHDSHIWRLSPVLGLLKHLHSIGHTSCFLLGLPSRDLIPSSTPTDEVDRQHGVLRGSSLPYDNSETENSSTPTKRHDENVAVIVPITLERATVVPDALDKPDSPKKSVMNDEPDDNHKTDATVLSDRIDESNVSDDQPKDPTNIPDKNKEPGDYVQSDLDAKKDLNNTSAVDKKSETDVEKNSVNQEYEVADTNNSKDLKGQEPELDSEYRLTMIHSVREAVNRICEQAVEKTAAIVRNRATNKRNSRSTLNSSLNDRDESEAADNASSEFSLPPPPQQNPLDSDPQGQESSWPPPPSLSEAEERTIAPGYSFDLPDPPTEMDQMDSETDKLDISDEEMKATGLPSDDDEKSDTIAGDGVAENNRPGKEINAVMKSTANGGSSDGSVDAAMAVAQDNGADDRAATTIQAVYRGFRARKYVEAVNAAAVKIQAGFRGYRVRQSLKNAAPSTATTTTDESQCWSDDDQKSVVSVTYTPLKEYGYEPRGVGDGRGDGDDGSDNSDDGQISGVVTSVTSDKVSSVPSDIGGGEGESGGGYGGGDSVGGGTVGGVHVGAGVEVGGVGVYKVDEDDDDQLQTGDDEVFERDDNEIGGGGGVGNSTTNPTITLSGTANATEVSTQDDATEAEALVQAAIKIQARVRGFAARKRMNEEKNDGAEKK